MTALPPDFPETVPPGRALGMGQVRSRSVKDAAILMIMGKPFFNGYSV